MNNKPKHILYKEMAREKLQSGVNQLANTVISTIGPKGRNVILDREFGSPLITNDGVSIAREIELADPFENMGAKIIKEAATKTNDIAGDGTTTATLLAQALINEGLDKCKETEDNKGANPVLLRRGMEKATEIAVEQLKEIAKPISTDEEIKQIATISSASEEIGTLIADAIKIVGKEGVITTQESASLDTKLEVIEGLEFDKGFISTFFASDLEKMETVLNNPYILVTDQKINFVKEIVKILEIAISQGRSLLIIAEDLESEVLQTLVANKQRGSLNVVAVKAPGFGERRKEMLVDIATVVNATFINSSNGLTVSDATLSDLGTAESVKISKINTLIVNGAGSKEEVEKRAEQIRAALKDENVSEYDKEKLEERLAKLTGGIATIKIGAATEMELKERKLRIEDAINATKAAIEEGIVAGGGTALNSLVPIILIGTEDLIGDERLGAIVVATAVSAPVIQIALNAGLDPSRILYGITERVKKSNNINIGYDAMNNEYVDMIEAGIIDPVKVTRSALQNASSVAATFLTTDAAVTSM